jgi:hypothetical protein
MQQSPDSYGGVFNGVRYLYVVSPVILNSTKANLMTGLFSPQLPVLSAVEGYWVFRAANVSAG